MLVLYHYNEQRLEELPADAQVTDSAKYCESVGRATCRRRGGRRCYLHTVEVEYDEAIYVGREPLADANLYRLKTATKVKSVMPMDC